VYVTSFAKVLGTWQPAKLGRLCDLQTNYTNCSSVLLFNSLGHLEIFVSEET